MAGHARTKHLLGIISLVALLIGVIIFFMIFNHNVYKTYVRTPVKGDKVQMIFLGCPAVLQAALYNKDGSNNFNNQKLGLVTGPFCDLPMDPTSYATNSTWYTNGGADWTTDGEGNLNNNLCNSISAALGGADRTCSNKADCYRYMPCSTSSDCGGGIKCLDGGPNGRKFCDWAGVGTTSTDVKSGWKEVYSCDGIVGDNPGKCVIHMDDDICGKGMTCSLSGILDTTTGKNSCALHGGLENCNDGPDACFHTVETTLSNPKLPLSSGKPRQGITSVSSPCTGCHLGQWCVANQDDGYSGYCAGEPKNPVALRVEFMAEGVVTTRTAIDDDEYKLTVDWKRIQMVYPFSPASGGYGLQYNGKYYDTDFNGTPDDFHQACIISMDNLNSSAKSFLFSVDGSERGMDNITELNGLPVNAVGLLGGQTTYTTENLWPLRKTFSMKGMEFQNVGLNGDFGDQAQSTVTTNRSAQIRVISKYTIPEQRKGVDFNNVQAFFGISSPASG